MKITCPADPLGSGAPVLGNMVTVVPVDGHRTLVQIDVVPASGWLNPETGAVRVELTLSAVTLAAALAAMKAMA